MKINAAGLMLCTFLVGCGSGPAPFGEDAVADDTPVVEEPTEPEDTIDSDGRLPPGTASPQPDTRIFRKEAKSEEGNGFAEGIRYIAENDTFYVDNLPFDGGDDTPYIRGQAVSSFGDYAVYEAVQQYPDSLTNDPINQFTHRAIYGVSRSRETEFAIIRTGAYADYGFGGFVYERNGTVVMPTQGQAQYNGKGAGLRDYKGAGGLDYITADVQVAIDFDDFNEDTGIYEGAVKGYLFNKRVYTLSGAEITDNVVGTINEENRAALTAIPTTVFTISPNVMDANGEITGGVTSPFNDLDGNALEYAPGQYYGILSGDNAEELVGIVVTESTRQNPGVTVRDTIGFTIYREPN
ncbi:MAG: hypothetical protein P1U53_16265 [Sulfitobacter sp.]|nr:hypothetical protein [Sulfitobacter sp.]